MFKHLLYAAAVTILAVPSPIQECRMAPEFHQPDANAPKKMTPVWSDPAGEALLFIESLNVNTDGTRRSYSVEDFWGEKTALNNLCNAMSDACAGLDRDGLRARRILTQKALAAGWPPDLLQQTKISASIIPFKSGKPCPLVNGFLVSATALRKPTIADVCDITNYVDALTVPALVLPGNPKNGRSGFAERNARVGDLAVALRSGATTPVFAVIGDTGPTGQLGEASVALNGKLLGKTAEPANYNEVRGRGEFAGKSWVVPRAIVLVFAKTRDVASPFMTSDRINESAAAKFEAWGGVPRLAACATEYERSSR